jgi:hypothetical protein
MPKKGKKKSSKGASDTPKVDGEGEEEKKVSTYRFITSYPFLFFRKS